MIPDRWQVISEMLLYWMPHDVDFLSLELAQAVSP